MLQQLVLVARSLERPGMVQLYAVVDAFVSASRGEGWNLPMMEAAAMGARPLIDLYSLSKVRQGVFRFRLCRHRFFREYAFCDSFSFLFFFPEDDRGYI